MHFIIVMTSKVEDMNRLSSTTTPVVQNDAYCSAGKMEFSRNAASLT